PKIKVDQLCIIPPVDWQILDFVLSQYAAKFIGGGLDLGKRVSRDLHFGRYLPWLHSRIYAALGGNVDVYSRGHICLKSVEGNRHRVSTDGEFWQRVAAVRAGLGGALQSGGDVL